MVHRLQTDATRFWQEALTRNGPIEVWIISGERFLFNGNHRFHAAVQAGVEIPDEMVCLVDKSGSQIATFLLADLVWLDDWK